jgi:putative transposase
VDCGESIRVASEVLSISTACYFYKPTLVNENGKIEDWLKRLTRTHKRWGFSLCYNFLRNTKGFKWNHKPVYLIYRELELNLRIKPRSRIKRDKPDALAVPAEINQV